MIRTRDLVAALGLLWLSSTAWNLNEGGSTASLSASIFLAFYVPTAPSSSKQRHAAVPAVLDVDGDGTPEALARWTAATTTAGNDGDGDTEFVLQVLDLRPLSQQQQRRQALAPFQPSVLLESEAVVVPKKKTNAAGGGGRGGGGGVPLLLTTGQVLTSSVVQPSPAKENKQDNENSSADRTVHYFCGATWHDAAERCAAPCPSGQMSDCPDGEKCFADTPCRAHRDGDQPAGTKSPVYEWLDSLPTTPAGGWPSMFTVWGGGTDDGGGDGSGSDTVVTMHSLTATNSSSTSTASSSDAGRRNNKNKRQKQPPLQIQQMWHVNPLRPAPGSKNFNNRTASLDVEWYDLAVEFVDALSAPLGSRAGVLLLTGTVYLSRPSSEPTPLPGEADDDDGEHEQWSTFVFALDALTGRTVWESFASAAVEQTLRGSAPEEAEREQLLLPITTATRGSTSAARRRSLLPVATTNSDNDSNKHANAGTAVANCLREYRGSLLTSSALPHQYSPSDGVRIQALHFDHRALAPAAAGVPPQRPHRRKRRRQHHHQHSSGGGSSWLSNIFSKKGGPAGARPLHYGRPNVVVTHNEQGLQVQSLRNGRSLCHLSLQEDTLYADVDRDGTLDSLQIVTSHRVVSTAEQLRGDDDAVARERKWVERLAEKVSAQNQRNRRKKMELISQQMADPKQQPTPLCHLLALSGIPTKEELFSTSLCSTSNKGGKKDGDGISSYHHQQQPVLGAPLLVVEPTSRGGRRAQNHRGHDIIAATNTGFVSRIRGNSGRRLWKRNGRRQYGSDAFPTWDDDTADTVLLDRVTAANRVIPSMRPIVLAGENSAALLAPGSGQLLGEVATFPQPSRRRPRLVDFDGDGTLDLLVSTRDAVWGYKIVVTTGASVLYRIVVGLLVMGLMLAFLRNRFGPHPGKRSTDL